MKAMTARDLKNSTGEVVRSLKRGETILLTFRGKPLGRIAPLGTGGQDLPAVRPFAEAWAEIEEQLIGSEPRFATWQEAEDQGRGRA